MMNLRTIFNLVMIPVFLTDPPAAGTSAEFLAMDYDVELLPIGEK